MMIDYTGQQIGSYRLMRRLGLGGFASVYLGQHMRIATKQAAIKLLHLFDVDSKKFRQEAETTAALEHPHIIHLIDFDFHDQMPFLVLDYAPGGSLRSRYPEGTQVPLSTVVQYVQEIAQALEYAHSKNVIHCDIKPDNVLIGARGELRLSDFGIAVLSQTGRSLVEVGGTAYYMAPEQSRGKPQKASDQYALGIMVYEWLCGKPPFTEGNAINIQYQHAYEPIPPLSEQLPMLPRDVEQTIQCTLAKDPKERFASVKDFAQALKAACSDTVLASIHLLVSAPPPEVSPRVPLAGNSRKHILDEIDNHSSSISGNGAASGTGASNAVADLKKKGTQQPVPSDASSASMDHDWDALPPTPSAPSSQTNAPSVSFAPGTTPPYTPSSTPDTPDPAVGTGPGIIELPSSSRVPQGQSTAKQSPMDAAAVPTSIVQPLATPPLRPASQRRDTGKTPVVAGAMAAASATHGVGASRSPVRGSRQARTGAGRRRPSSRGLIATILIIAILLISGSIVASASGLQLFYLSLLTGGNTPPATITITPDSKVEQDSYVIQAVTSNADPTKRQVSLRQLTFSPQKQSKTFTATGVGHIAAKAATGQLTFYNGSDQNYWIASTNAIPGPNGVSVVPDESVDIPAAHVPTVGSVTINAHAITLGASSNMAAGAINENCCASGGFIKVVSSAFTGGQDEKHYTFLQQSDVDGFVNQLKSILSQQAQNAFKSQLKSNEQLVGDPQCTTQPTVDQPVGDQGQNVTSANVTVNTTCTGLAYDASGAQTLARNLLRSKAANDLGQGYALAGTTITKQAVIDVKDSVVTLQVVVAGTWYYQFDDEHKQALAEQLVNKSREAAQRLLNGYRGIAKAKIDITTGDGNTLPRTPQQISIMILGVSGASPRDLPPLPAIEPTSPLSVSKGRG